MACLYALPQGCCENPGPWDWWQDGWGENTVSPPETYGTPFFARTAGIYLGSMLGGEYTVADFDSYDAWFVEIEDTGEGRSFQGKQVLRSICALSAANDLAYFYVADNGQHFCKWRFEFSRTAMGFLDEDASTDIIFAWDASESVKFHTTATITDLTQTEFARFAIDPVDDVTPITWETLGVPSGATVVGASLVSLRRRVVAVTNNLTSHAIAIRILDAAGDPILDGDLLASTALPTTTSGSYTTIGQGAEQPVTDPGDEASSTVIQIELEYGFVLSGTGTDPMEVRLDNLVLEIHYHVLAINGYICVNVATQAVAWIVPDPDWYAIITGYDIDDNELYEASPINVTGPNAFVLGHGAPSPTSFDTHPNVVGGSGAHSDGLVEWTSDLDIWRQTSKRITNGGITFETLSFDDLPAEANGYSYLNTFDGELDLFYPIGQAPQSNRAAGIRYPHLIDFVGEPPGEDDVYEARAEVAIGPINDTLVGNLTVYGTIWTKTADYVGRGGFGAAEVIFARVDAFDAGPTASIAIITYMWHSSYGSGPPFANEIRAEQDLVVNSTTKGTENIWVAARATGGLWDAASPDNSAYYPWWIAPRVLQLTEAAQGGGQRCAVFARVPASGTPTALYRWTLKVYVGSTLDYSLTGNWGYVSQASGTMTLDTTTPAAFSIYARLGADADGAVANGTLDLTIEQSTIEDAVYDSVTNTLNVKINISGGNDTVADLRAVINAAGDFTAIAGSGDADTITTANTGSATMVGGVSTPGSTVSNYLPYIHDSSDRYYYLINFPLVVRELIGNRWTALRGPGEYGSFPTQWMISHNGLIKNPLGVGDDREKRSGGAGAPSNTNFSSIKHSASLDLAPALGKI